MAAPDSASAVQPVVVLLCGPNGVGKTTVAGVLLPRLVGVTRFVNADAIAVGLSGFEPHTSALAAGRVMLARLRELAGTRESFAFETTLASRVFAPMLRELRSSGYEVQLVYLYLNDPELAVSRVTERARRGGHDVPVGIVRRRYWNGLRNLFELYLPIVHTWRVFDNSGPHPVLVAHGSGPQTCVLEANTWQSLLKAVSSPR